MNDRTNADLLPNPAESSDGVLRFDAFGFDLSRGELRGPDGTAIALRPKADALLRCFLAEPGRLLSRDRLMSALWPATVVTDDSLVQCVGELRHAFGDRGAALIRTVPRRGYRLETTVTRAVFPASAAPAAAAAAGIVPAPLDAPSNATPAPPARPVSRRATHAWRAVAGCAVAAALVAAVALATSSPRMKIDETIAARAMVAVLPFAIDEPASRSAADAIEDDIAAQFATRPGMRAIGRTATARLLGDPDPMGRAARELKASRVVTGRIGAFDHASGTVAVHVQLVSVDPRSVIWAARFDLTPARIGAGTTDVGHHVVNAVRSNGDRPEALAARIDERTADPAELTQLGWNALDRNTSQADARIALRRFDRALASDPESLIALNGRAAAFLRLYGHPGDAMTEEERLECERAVERSHRVGPSDATSLLIWGSFQNMLGHPELALPAIDRAIGIVPSYANGHTLRAESLLLLGRTDEVQGEVDRAVALSHANPSSVGRAWRIGAESALMRGDAALALEMARRSIAQMPSNPQAHGVLAAAEMAAGDPTRAAAAVGELLRLWPQATVSRYDRRRPSTHPAFVVQRQRFLAALLQAGLPPG